nr:MAG TPA: hypothetical protein [Caudoviricetes sp.]
MPTIDEQLRKFGETITGTPAPKDESGQVEMQAHYTINPQNVAKNKQNFNGSK